RPFKCAVDAPHGLILVTGPTGSGKTTTLYSALNELNSPAYNIVTVEDPVEFQIPGINQVPTKKEIGLTFANALRSILRQDPDIIMIGEIRDTETAEIAVEAALTGHQVLSIFDGVTLYRGRGCERCKNSGYAGRFAIIEAMTITDEIRKLIISRANSRELGKIAIGHGMRTLRMVALDRVRDGISTLEQVLVLTSAH